MNNFDSYLFGIGVGFSMALGFCLWASRPPKRKTPRTVRGIGSRPWFATEFGDRR